MKFSQIKRIYRLKNKICDWFYQPKIGDLWILDTKSISENFIIPPIVVEILDINDDIVTYRKRGGGNDKQLHKFNFKWIYNLYLKKQ